MSSDTSNVFLCLAPLFFLLAAIFIVVGILNRNKAKKAGGWPSVPGKVIEARLEEHASTDPEDFSMANFRPVIAYQYEVNSQVYTSNKTGVIAMNYDQKTAQKKLDAFPVGSALTVYYNPEKPEDALLNPSKGTANIFLIIGIVALVVSCAFTTIWIVQLFGQ
jgi:hypothetical protein